MLPSGLNTYAGILVSVIALAVRASGYELAPGADEQINSLVFLAFEIGGMLYAAYGRARAESPGWLVKKN